jgi:hypothetical protein
MGRSKTRQVPDVPKPLRFPTEGDKDAMRHWIGRKHVGTSDASIIADLNDRIDDAIWLKFVTCTDEVRAQWHAAALEIHHANRELYHGVMDGSVC